MKRTENIPLKLLMDQTCNYKLYCKKIHRNLLKLTKYANSVVHISGHYEYYSAAIMNIIQLLTYVEVGVECYRTVNVIVTDAERRSI